MTGTFLSLPVKFDTSHTSRKHFRMAYLRPIAPQVSRMIGRARVECASLWWYGKALDCIARDRQRFDYEGTAELYEISYTTVRGCGVYRQARVTLPLYNSELNIFNFEISTISSWVAGAQWNYRVYRIAADAAGIWLIIITSTGKWGSLTNICHEALSAELE